MDICVLREYPQTENEFLRWRNSKRKTAMRFFYGMEAAAREPSMTGAPKKPKE